MHKTITNVMVFFFSTHKTSHTVTNYLILNWIKGDQIVKKVVYIRLMKNIKVPHRGSIKLKDIALLYSLTNQLEDLKDTPIYTMTKQDQQIAVIDRFLIIDQLIQRYEDLEYQFIGPQETIVRLDKIKQKPSVWIVSFVWFLLFIGTAMTIMNFHYDVSMQEVQQKLHYLFTGEENEFPLWIQIPYSIGLGLGMLLFFNRWFKKKFNEEPSPLEVELFNYQQDLDQYVSYYENEVYDKDHSD